MCFDYRGITLLSLPGKAYWRVLERTVCLSLVEPWKQEQQCGCGFCAPALYPYNDIWGCMGVYPTSLHVVVFEESIQLRSSDYPVGNCFGSIGCLTHSYQPFNPCITVTGAWLVAIFRNLFGKCWTQGCPLSPMRLIVFMDKISSSTQVVEGFL